MVKQDHKVPFALYDNISWQPLLYLRGVNLTDMNYDITLHNYRKKIGTQFAGLLKEWDIKVHIVCTQNSLLCTLK